MKSLFYYSYQILFPFIYLGTSMLFMQAIQLEFLLVCEWQWNSHVISCWPFLTCNSGKKNPSPFCRLNLLKLTFKCMMYSSHDLPVVYIIIIILKKTPSVASNLLPYKSQFSFNTDSFFQLLGYNRYHK